VFTALDPDGKNTEGIINVISATMTIGSTLRYPFEERELTAGIYILKTIAGGVEQTTQVIVR
jgi:hypothetical protein